MSLSFSSASHNGQPSGLGPLRYSMRQGAQRGWAASGVGPRSSSGIGQLLAVVVFHAAAEVVELAGMAVPAVAQPLIQTMRGLEPGVSPQLDPGNPEFRRLALHQADQAPPEALPARRSGDVELLQQDCVGLWRRDHPDTGDQPPVELGHPEATALVAIRRCDREQLWLFAVHVQHTAGVLRPAARDQTDQVPGIVIASGADLEIHPAERNATDLADEFGATGPAIESRLRGALAQLGERLHGMQEVTGSIPVGSNSLKVPPIALCINPRDFKAAPSVVSSDVERVHTAAVDFYSCG